MCACLILTAVTASAQVDVLTVNYDNSRTNSNLSEYTLSPANVNPGQFGRLATLQVDGQVYAQPLVVTGVNVPGHGQSDLVIVATMRNFVYAFDANATGSPAPLWTVWLGPPVPSSDYNSDFQYTDITPEIGILSTPVIDRQTGTLYVVNANRVGKSHSHTLHALDLASGRIITGPMQIRGSVFGIGETNVGGVITFDSFQHLQRPGLLLSDGVVYAAFGSHADQGIFFGWIMGYDAADITRQVSVFNTTPDAYGGSIWMSGHGMAAGSNGAIYAITGNGDADGRRDFGESFIKLDGRNSLALLDWFTPSNWQQLDDFDRDLGSTSPILIPGTDLLIGGGKEGVLYVLKQSNLGHYTEGNSNIVTSVQAVESGIFDLAVFPRQEDTLIYIHGWGESVKIFRLAGERLEELPRSQSVLEGNIPFGGMTVTAAGNLPGSAIFWLTSTDGGQAGTLWPGTLHAYVAEDLSVELWNSDLDAADRLPSFTKFVSPTVANGRVFVPTLSGQVAVYGLKSTDQAEQASRPIH
ncbi:MAG: hypothetical protein HZB13_21405 [Acidobacteria bacterium]|nr:hypothetical protein [Acidobacteriota bacterium]